VVAAQSFQWASPETALPELHRILAPGGWLTVLWNAHRVAADPILLWTYRELRRLVPRYDYVDRTTRARRLATHALGNAPEPLQRWLVAASTRRSDPGRLSRGLSLRTFPGFGPVVYREAAHRVTVTRDGYLDLWRSRNRLREIAGPHAFAAFIAALGEHLESRRIAAVAVPYLCGSWSTRRR
jgi:hypothetical protein